MGFATEEDNSGAETTGVSISVLFRIVKLKVPQFQISSYKRMVHVYQKTVLECPRIVMGAYSDKIPPLPPGKMGRKSCFKENKPHFPIRKLFWSVLI